MSQHKTLIAILWVVLPVAACSRSDEKQAPAAATARTPETPGEGSGETAKTQPPAAPAAPGPTTAPSKTATAGREVDAAGLTLKLEDNGHVTLVGKDRWGAAINTTYETRDFLLKALPVLERSISAEQVAAIRKTLGAPPEARPATK